MWDDDDDAMHCAPPGFVGMLLRRFQGARGPLPGFGLWRKRSSQPGKCTTYRLGDHDEHRVDVEVTSLGLF
jgi:hypothetical protein